MSEVRTVRWIDSSIQNVQVGSEDFPRPARIVSIGFVVDETEEYVTLARDDHGDGEWRGLVAIPKIAILE